MGLAVAVVVALFGDDLWGKAAGVLHRDAGIDARVEQTLEECRQKGFSCRTTKTVRIANGQGELTVVGVDLVNQEFVGSSVGSAILVFDSSGALRWKSPIEAFSPGYGLVRLETDVTNHLFADFAVTNHSGIAWVLDLSTMPIKTFGTVGGTGLVVDGFDEPDLGGVRRLTAHREGWPANARNPTTSRDVFTWNGSEYVFTACEIIVPPNGERWASVLRVIPAGSGTCQRPIGKYSVDLSGDRDPRTPPP